MDGQFERQNRLARRSSTTPAAFQPTAFSWQRRPGQMFARYDQQESNQLIRQNAVSAMDVIFALIEREVSKVRELIPRVNLAEIGKRMTEQIQRMFAFLGTLSGSQQRSLAGKDALLDTDLLNLDRMSLVDELDDLDSISLDNSTICTATDNKRLAELEAQLAELRSTVGVLTSALQQRSVTQSEQALSPPPDPVKEGAIPPISSNPPMPPPPPPFSNKSELSIIAPVAKSKQAPEDEEKENFPKVLKSTDTSNGDFMSVLSEALKKRRKMIGNGISMSTFEELETSKSANMSTGDHLLCAIRDKVPPPELNESQDSDWLERDDEDWR